MGSPTQVDQGGLTYVVGGLSVATTPGATPTAVISSTGVITGTGVTSVVSATSPATLDASLADVFTVTPTATLTINATNPTLGKRFALIVLTSGTSSYTVTFGTNFKTTGTLATGTTDAKYFVLTFVGDGTRFYEVSRTAAM